MKVFSKILMTLSIAGFAFSANAVELADGKLSINGFADGQAQYTKDTPSPGFLLNDAALYFKAGNKKVDLNIDLPFSGGGADNSFSFATGKAQAYVALHPTANFDFWMGQFDTIYGFELNDTKDVTFTTQGLIFENALPTTHQGAMVAYNNQGVSVKALVSDPDNSGHLYGENLEFGGQVGYTHDDMFNVALGYLAHNQEGDAGMDTLIDVVAGVKASIVDVDAEFAWNKVGSGDAGWGILGQAVVQATDEMSFGLRGEYLKKLNGVDTNADGDDDAVNDQDMQLTVGPQFKPAGYDGLTLKADYTWNSSKLTSSSDRENTHGINFAMVYAF